ncbi:MAG: VOC family protein [Bacteroidota bacterium]
MFLHVRLKVRDLERSIAFYTQHFDFSLRRRKSTPRGSQLAFLAMEGTPTEIELAYLPWDPDFHVDEDILHLAFSVPDIQEAVARLRAAGVPITEEPMQLGGGTWIAFVEDPDGYEIELIAH